MSKVYVVYYFTDHRKENQSDILGVFTSKKSAKIYMKNEAKKYAEEKECEMESGKNFIQDSTGEHIFSLRKKTLQE